MTGYAQRSKRKLGVCRTAGALALAWLSGSAYAGDTITFTEIADDPITGIDYRRERSASFAIIDALRRQSLQTPIDPALFPETPFKTHGEPGVAVLDYDGDGDLDIYVTNGPGMPNSLYSNQLVETGAPTFLDVAESAGVAATDQDGNGVCYGDIDNDGDPDLLVLGRDEPNRLFANRGDGTFAEVPGSGLEGGSRSSPSCAMGDVDGDGLLDVAIANAFNHDSLLACLVEPFALNQHNQLFRNQGGHSFVDISASAGIEDLAGFPPEAAGAAGIAWAVGMVDVDFDGDTDILFAEDQCAMRKTATGGVDRGFVHVMLNDGSGRFQDIAGPASSQASGSWMGLDFGDLNCDGHLDMFGSNFGDYGVPLEGNPYTLGDEASRWLLGNGDGTFTDPGVGDLVSSVFGWGTAIFDYDNDGDPDIVYYGGIDENVFTIADNPDGVLLRNDQCTARFEVDEAALPANQHRGAVQGVAIGDLDRNGFVDIVNVSSFDYPGGTLFQPNPTGYGSVFDAHAFFVSILDPTPGGFVWNGIDFLRGTLSILMNSGDNGNRWVQVNTLGTKGMIDGGHVNRDGIGAVIFFTPHRGQTAMIPVKGGSSFASQNSLDAIFGMGKARRGMVEILWPGGVRNRLYHVRHTERIVFPEIPCSYDAEWDGVSEYMSCVRTALDQLGEAGVLGPRERHRFFASAILAFVQR